MRRRIQVRTAEESSHTTNIWIEHLLTRIIVEQLNLPQRLQAKLLYDTLTKNNRGED